MEGVLASVQLQHSLPHLFQARKAVHRASCPLRPHKRARLELTALQRSTAPASGYLAAGPEEPPPSYEAIDRQPLNRAMMALFRSRLVSHLQKDSQLPGYDGVMELTKDLSRRYPTPKEVQQNTVRILSSLFPSWLPPAFKAVLSANIPGPACKLNAWVTAFTCQWLMGPSQVTSVERDDGSQLSSQGVKIERCRFLEASACASVCINCCKVPTQEFFRTEMGLPLRMTPNYEDYSCQFDFGLEPLPPKQDEAFKVPCFEQCPTKHRQKHQCKTVVAPS